MKRMWQQQKVLGSVEDPSDQSRIVVDIESSRRHFGRLAVFDPDGDHFLPQERSLLMAYAGDAAAALETAAALAESRDPNTTLSALLALGMALAEQSSRAGVAKHLAEAIPQIAGCDQAHVLLWDEGDAHLARNRFRPLSFRPTRNSRSRSVAQRTCGETTAQNVDADLGRDRASDPA